MLIAVWQPIGPNVWHVESEIGRIALWTLFGAGWLLVLVVSFSINHFDLFGTRRVGLELRVRAYCNLPFRTPGIYKLVRHALYVGWMVAFRATPTMSVGHLLFTRGTAAYMPIAIPFEERDFEERDLVDS